MNNNKNYKNLYLKYKTKYLKLKKQLAGSSYVKPENIEKHNKIKKFLETIKQDYNYIF